MPAVEKLRNRRAFRAVYDGGTKRSSRTFTVFFLENGLGRRRFGVTTTRKIGKATDRNRVRRRVWEMVRKSIDSVPEGCDVVVNPRVSARTGRFEDLLSELQTVFRSRAA